MASDTTSDGFDYSGPLSKRAIRLMRELQGLKLFDADPSSGVQPDSLGTAAGGGTTAGAFGAAASPLMAGGFGSTGDTAARKPKDKPNKLLSRFNRDVYIRDTRSSHAGNLAAALFVLLAIIGLAFVASWKVLVPKIGALNEQLSGIATAPAETAALRAQIEAKTTQQAAAQARLSLVQAQLMTPEQSLGAITQFLASLREGRVQLLSQKNTIGQTTANPYVAAGKAGAAKGAAAPAATAVVKPGLNYNHYELLLSGSYSGYIFARQTLVTMVPNLIIHYEDIGAMDQNPAQLSIRVYFSLPFLAK